MIEVLKEWLSDLQIDLFNADNLISRLKIYGKMEKISELLDSQYTNYTFYGPITITIDKETI